MLEFVCLPWSEVCSARVTSLLLLILFSPTRSGVEPPQARDDAGSRSSAADHSGNVSNVPRWRAMRVALFIHGAGAERVGGQQAWWHDRLPSHTES